MNDNYDHQLNHCLEIKKRFNVLYLGQQWAKKYLQTIEVNSFYDSQQNNLNLRELALTSSQGREQTAQSLMAFLPNASLQAWNKTEALLSEEIKRHRIDLKLINPWEITADAFQVYEQILYLYTQQITSQEQSTRAALVPNANSEFGKIQQISKEQVASTQLVTAIIASIGALRKKYTQIDPRIIGFVSMQFHYTSLSLLQTLSPLEQTLLRGYLKVIDDHLYMPLQRAYEAAGEHDYNSITLTAVQKLLPISTQISQKICQKVVELYPTHRSLSGALNDPFVKISSIRDIEIFQVYLWVCALEESINAIQKELFPICVMLYPRLQVQWELIRCMLHLLEQEITQHLTAKQANTLIPYLQVLWHMFSPKVFGELVLEK